MQGTTDAASTAALAERERKFFNERAGLYVILRRLIWRGIGEFNRNDEIDDLYDPRGKRVLLYGCGPANGVTELLERGAEHVTGIDIADADIALARERAREGGYADRTNFEVADAHHTGFPDGSFDVIVGMAILHHLDVKLALAELRRLLAPGGRAVFLEPLVHNPLLRLGRWLTPAARTDDEHPFTVDDWRLCAEEFPRFSHREVEFTSIPLMPLNLLLPRRRQHALARRVKALDDRLLERHPGLRPYARSTLLVLEA
jgi:ubiquinone/menaquinone biosynthesis C-methylase UbiE